MAYLHNNEYYTGYFAEGSSDYAGQQGPGYTYATISPTTNSAKTIDIYFAEPVICESASGSFYKASAPSYKTDINVRYRLSSTKAWTSTRPSEPIDAMILTNSRISGYSQGISGFVWTFESKFSWGDDSPEPEPEDDPTKYYYIKGTGGTNSCSTMGTSLSGNLAFECVIKLNSIGFVPWGISADSGWGGSDSADLRFFTTTSSTWYCDWGNFRVGPNSLSGDLLDKIKNYRIRLRVTKAGMTVTVDETGEVILNYSFTGTGIPNGPWMMGTTSNFQFYEGKVWDTSSNTTLIDCKADRIGLKNKLDNTYYNLQNVTYGSYDEISSSIVYPDLTPQVDNYCSTKLTGLYLRRRAVTSAKPIAYSIVEYISWPNNREMSTSNAYKVMDNGFNWAAHKVVFVADLQGNSLISNNIQNTAFCGVLTNPSVRNDIFKGGSINYGYFGTNVNFTLNSSGIMKDPLNDKYYTVWSSGGIWMYYSAGTLEDPFLYGDVYLSRTGSPDIRTSGPFYIFRNGFAVKFYGMEIYTNPGNVLVKRLLPCEYNGLDCVVDVDNKQIYLPDGSDPINI